MDTRPSPPGAASRQCARGGFEGIKRGFSPELRPDLPDGVAFSHPTAGVTCVGARDVLLAWNVFVSGIDVADARTIASIIREKDGDSRVCERWDFG